jgi:hypothetical protein
MRPIEGPRRPVVPKPMRKSLDTMSSETLAPPITLPARQDRQKHAHNRVHEHPEVGRWVRQMAEATVGDPASAGTGRTFVESKGRGLRFRIGNSAGAAYLRMRIGRREKEGEVSAGREAALAYTS